MPVKPSRKTAYGHTLWLSEAINHCRACSMSSAQVNLVEKSGRHNSFSVWNITSVSMLCASCSVAMYSA